MIAKYLALAAYAAGAALSCAQAAEPATGPVLAKPSETAGLQYLKAEEFLPQRVLPMPAARGSEQEANELATLHHMIAGAKPERFAQAAADNDLEDPSIFNGAVGLDLMKMPATWNLLVAVQNESEAAIGVAKDAFDRMRPYGVDSTLPTCVKVNRDKPGRSYPSGHASLGWSVGWMLAHLLPELAPAILDRANQYALNRQFCGVHYPSDTEASHVLATVVADRLLNDPRLSSRIAAARAELLLARPDLSAR